MARANSTLLPALAYWRIHRYLSQERLAERIAMRRNAILRIEAGYPALVRTARRLAEALEVQVGDLQRQPPDT